jgi:hypothetical protein
MPLTRRPGTLLSPARRDQTRGVPADEATRTTAETLVIIPDVES